MVGDQVLPLPLPLPPPAVATAESPSQWRRQGFAVVPGVLTVAQCLGLEAAHVASALSHSASGGTRSLLAHDWCVALAQRLREHPGLVDLIPAQHRAVQCTYFEKSASQNWLVPLHQDLSLPVAERVSCAQLQGWSVKEDCVFVHGPVQVLDACVAVRLHLDACAHDDGPLRVVPGSHAHAVVAGDAADALRQRLGEVVCEVPQGGACVMRPLLLHASSKSRGTGRRRVLHFLYGPSELPYGLRWHTAV